MNEKQAEIFQRESVNFTENGGDVELLLSFVERILSATTPTPQSPGVEGEMAESYIVAAAARCLSPQQYDSFMRLSENDPTVFRRLGGATLCLATPRKMTEEEWKNIHRRGVEMDKSGELIEDTLWSVMRAVRDYEGRGE